MYRLNRAIHLDSDVPNQPNWDTLIGVCNPFTVPVQIAIRCYGLDGVEIPNSPIVFTLEAGHSLATTFISNNVFPNPPQNYNGDATISFTPTDLPAMACLGGGGPSPRNWNVATPNVQISGTIQKGSGVGSQWIFPYVIPYFRDPVQHAGNQEYRAGLFIRNNSSIPVDLSLIYTVGDTYANAQEQITANLHIEPGAAVSEQLHELMPAVLTMNPRAGMPGEFEGSEGWLAIHSTQPADLSMWLICTNPGYDAVAFTQAPWVY